MVESLRNVPGWVWASALPFGLGAWAPLVPAARMRRRSWALWGVLWCVISLAGWLAAVVNDGGGGAGLLIILAWCGAVATCLSIRPEYLRLTSSSWTAAMEQARERLAERKEALRMAAEQPELAAEVGVGRPDRPGARDAGVVDVNNAPASVLADLPSIDDALATRIVEGRAEIQGFSSLADMGSILDLDGNQVDALRNRVVFLPR